ncbi:MAG: hypothetical protein HC875_00135 [Anaerolineales bacterium]|nr:hypothetical protein [Anaerolineales bacterium]
MIFGFIGVALITDKIANRIYLRRLDPRPEIEHDGPVPFTVTQPMQALTPSGLVVTFLPEDPPPAATRTVTPGVAAGELVAPDDLARLEGIGPKIKSVLAAAGPAVLRTYKGLRDNGSLEGKHLIVVSTAESEMIGSDLLDLVTKMKPGSTFFHSQSLSDDEWTGRDRVLQWLCDNYGRDQAAGRATGQPALATRSQSPARYRPGYDTFSIPYFGQP